MLKKLHFKSSVGCIFTKWNEIKIQHSANWRKVVGVYHYLAKAKSNVDNFNMILKEMKIYQITYTNLFTKLKR